MSYDSISQYVIAGPVDSEDGTLYWSNDDGWGFLSTATVFKERGDLDLPMDGRWVELPHDLLSAVDYPATTLEHKLLKALRR